MINEGNGKPRDLTAELNDIRGRLEALEQKLYVISHTQDQSNTEQNKVNLKGLLKRG